MKVQAATFLAVAASLVQLASAHYRFTELIIGGKKTGEYVYVRKNTNHNSPITDVTSPDMICNAGGLVSGPDTAVATVAAGDTVGFGTDQAVYHDGPLTIWMSKSTTTNVTDYKGDGGWFKVHELGAVIGPGSIKFPASNTAQFNFKIPACLPAGEYLVRAEQIGLHVAQSKGGAQFYIGCGQLQVTGGGGSIPRPTVKIPGEYTGSEPGILINIYTPVPTKYEIPGGPMAAC